MKIPEEYQWVYDRLCKAFGTENIEYWTYDWGYGHNLEVKIPDKDYRKGIHLNRVYNRFSKTEPLVERKCLQTPEREEALEGFIKDIKDETS